MFSCLLLVCLPLGVQGFAGDNYLSQPLNAEDHVISDRLRDVESVPTELMSIDAFDRTGDSRINTLTQPECTPTLNDGGVKTEYIREGVPAVLVKVAPCARALIAQAKQTFSTGSELTGGRATPTQGDSRTYRVRPGDTLLRIVRDHMIDERFSLQQKMIATWRANPEAFSGNNINNLRTDRVLRLPDSAYIALISRETARTEVARQYANWLELRATSPEGTPPAAAEMTIEAPPHSKQPIGLNEAEEGRVEIPALYETDLQQDIVAAPDYVDVTELQQKVERMRALAESRQQEREQLIAENRELKEIIAQQERLIERQREKLAHLEQSSPEKVGASDPELPAEA